MKLDDYRRHRDKLILNLGCGTTKPSNHFGIDIQDLPGVDLVADLNDGIPIETATFDIVAAFDFLEHIEPKKNIFIMEEIYRVLKPGGTLEFLVPTTDWGGMGAFQDPTHISYWNQMKFKYFLHEKYGGFRLLYNIKCWFKAIGIETFLNDWNIPYCRGILEKEVALT